MTGTQRSWSVVAALAVVVAVWLAAGPLSNLRSSTNLTKAEIEQLATVKRAVGDDGPIAPPTFAYAEHLEKTFAGRIDGDVVRVNAAWLTNPRLIPIQRKLKDPVDGVLTPPVALKAVASVKAVTLDWGGSSGEHADVVSYRIYRVGRAQVLHTVDASEATEGSYSFTDDSIEPETAYSYYVRAVARPSAQEPGQKIRKPAGAEMVDDKWVSAKSDVVAVKTPTGIEFECKGIDRPHEGWRANITFRWWDKERAEWQQYQTVPGIFKGKEIVGHRRVNVLRRKFLKTGYIVQDVRPNEVVEDEVIDRRHNKDGDIEDITVLVPRVVSYIVIHHAGKDDTRTLYVGGKK